MAGAFECAPHHPAGRVAPGRAARGPSLLRAALQVAMRGADDAIPRVPREALAGYLGKPLRAALYPAQAEVFFLEVDGRRLVLKDYSAHKWFWWFLANRGTLRREIRALRRLQGMEGIPQLVAQVGRYGLLMQRLEARPLENARREMPPPELFPRLEALVQRMHSRGVGHGDIRRANILVDAQYQPHLIDFGTAMVVKTGRLNWFSRRIFRFYCAVDRLKPVKLKLHYYPDALTDADRAILRQAPWGLRLGEAARQWIYKPVRRLLRRLRQGGRRPRAGPMSDGG